jgi:hypothetical protein
MSLQPCTRLGNYEVLSELGCGGMGAAYRARERFNGIFNRIRELVPPE